MAERVEEVPTEDEVLAIARCAIKQFHEAHETELENIQLPEKMKRECSFDLGYKGVSSLPEELVDILKDEVTRIALSHNQLSSLSGLSSRFSECTRLRYLVLRNNDLREFPSAILSVPTLETLDLKNNKLEALPEDFSRLHQLKCCSIQQNKISRLPLCIGNMTSLTRLATYKCPIVFPPRDRWTIQKDEHEVKDEQQDREMRETRLLKQVLLEHQHRGRSRTELDGAMSEGSLETPRPIRRKGPGRFPLKPSVSVIELSSINTPSSPHPPPVPSKSHARPSPHHYADPARPNPVHRPNLSERNRSNSESQMSTTYRSRRGGLVMRKTAELEKSDLKQTFKLSQHYRGLSHGSAIRAGMLGENSNIDNSSSPSSPVEGEPQRTALLKRLSSLPENEHQRWTKDPIVELARGVLYSMDQIHRPIKDLLGTLTDPQSRRSNLEQTCHAASSTQQRLDREVAQILSYDQESDADACHRSYLSIQTLCHDCIREYDNLITALRRDARTLIIHGSQQHVRTLMVLLYASSIEIRNACSRTGFGIQTVQRKIRNEASHGKYDAPSPAGRPATSLRAGDGKRLPNALNSRRSPSGGRPVPLLKAHTLNIDSRSNNGISFATIASQSVESTTPFNPSPAVTQSSTPINGQQDSEEDQQFKRIFTKLLTACEHALTALPSCSYMLKEFRQAAIDGGRWDSKVAMYESLCDKCTTAAIAAEQLKKRLRVTKIKDPDVRSQRDFWQLCRNFTMVFTMLGSQVKEMTVLELIPDRVGFLLKPVHRTVKEASTAVKDSPWGHLAATGQQAILQPSQHRPLLSLHTRSYIPPPNPLDPLSAVSSHSQSGASSGYIAPLPAPPLSAALGPAALATMPNAVNGSS